METTKQVEPTVLGSFDVTLLLDAAGSNPTTTIEVRSTSDRVAREVPLVLGALLFAQQQVRKINDPARIAAVEKLAEATAAARGHRLGEPTVPTDSRVVASYQIKLLANGGFRIEVEEKLTTLLSDTSGGLTTGALPARLLTTLPEPYRTFYREMLDAAVAYWREQRPSLLESTWVWAVALRRLDQLVRQGVEGLGEPQACANCGALRPAGFACLHCQSAPGAGAEIVAPSASTTTAEQVAPSEPPAENQAPPTAAAEAVTVATAPPPVKEPEPAAEPVASQSVAQTLVPPTPAPAPDPAPAAVTPPTPPPAARPPVEHAILPAREVPPGTPEAPVQNEVDRWPLAGLPRRGIALLIDLVISVVVGTLGAYGLTQIFLALGSFGPGDDPQQFAMDVSFILIALYFVLGWTGRETFGMQLCRIQVVQQADRTRCGLFPAIGRGIGYLILLALGVAVFFVGMWIDNHIFVFIPTGTPTDDAIRAIIILIALYVLWNGSGQRILGEAARQTWGDKIGKTIVVARQKS